MSTEHDKSLITDVAVTKTEVEQLKQVIFRIDEAIAKMNEISGETSKILAVHSNKLNNQDLAIESLKITVQQQRDDSADKISALQTKIESVGQMNHTEREKNHREILDGLRRLENKFDTDTGKLNDRLSALEKWRWWIMGAIAVAGFVMAKMPLIQSLF